MSFIARFNPKTGIADFWHEFRKPNPLRIPILVASMVPVAVIFYWLTTETVYMEPARPDITYITTYDPDRSDEEIVASNLENQEVKELREAEEERVAQRKRDLYKALGAAAGMDVEEIAAEADAERAAEEAAEARRRAEMFGRSNESEETAQASPEESTP